MPIFSRNSLLYWFSLVALVCSAARADDAESPFKLRLAKAPDASSASSPATLTYQRSDGGDSDYITQGAAIGNYHLSDTTTIAPSASWNHNTIAKDPTNMWKAELGASNIWLYRCPVCSHNTDRIKWSGSVGHQRDIIKSSNAAIAKVDATWYTGFFEMPPAGTLDFAALRPTLTLFVKNVRDAAADKKTNIKPTGTMNGELVGFTGYLNKERWHLDASFQLLHTEKTVAGDRAGSNRLSKISLRYEFVDSPRTSEELKDSAAQWIPAISLSRQVGEDPLNAVARAGFTQLAFTLQY